MSIPGGEEGKLLKRKDFLGVDEEAGSHPNRTYYYKKSSDLQKIIETCTRKLETDSRNAKALLLRGNAFLKLRDYESAISDISDYLVSDPSNEAALYNRGIALSKIGQPNKAILDMSRVLQLNPSHVNAAFARAACYNAIGLFTKAIEDYNFALLKDEAGPRTNGTGGYLSDRASAGTPLGIDVSTSFYHDDTKSPLPWMSPSGTGNAGNGNRSRSGSYQDTGPVNVVGTPMQGDRQMSPQPWSHHYGSDGETTTTTSFVHRLSSASPSQGNKDLNSSAEKTGPNDMHTAGSIEEAEAEYALGYKCRKQGDFRKAIVHYSNAIKLNPRSFKSVFNRGFAYDKLEDFRHAITDYSTAASIEPENAFAFYNRGITLDRSGDLAAACADFARAIQLQPKNIDFLHNYGNCLRKVGHFQEAAQTYTSALDLAPNGSNFKALFNRGVCFEKLERMSDALNDYNSALKLQAKHTQTLINRANVLLALGNIDECSQSILAVAEMALSNKQKISVATIKANVFERQGKLAEAMKEIENALALENASSSSGSQSEDVMLLLSTRANIYKSLEDYHRAISDLTSAINMNPVNPSTCYSIRGFCWRKLGNFEEAANDYGRCIQHHMTVFNASSGRQDTESRQLGARHYNNRAYCYAKLGRYSEAINDYTSAIKLDPTNSHAYHNRGTSYDKIGKGDLAINDFSKVLELDSATDGQSVGTATSASSSNHPMSQSNPSAIHGRAQAANSFPTAGNSGYVFSPAAYKAASPISAIRKQPKPVSPDRSVSTIGENSVSNERISSTGMNGGYNHLGADSNSQAYADHRRPYPMHNSGMVQASMNEASMSDNSHRGVPIGSYPNAQAIPGSNPPSRYNSWNAARVNSALDSVAQVAAAPISQSNLQIRSNFPGASAERASTGLPHYQPRGVRHHSPSTRSVSPSTRPGGNIRAGMDQMNGRYSPAAGAYDRKQLTSTARSGSAPPTRSSNNVEQPPSRHQAASPTLYARESHRQLQSIDSTNGGSNYRDGRHGGASSSSIGVHPHAAISQSVGSNGRVSPLHAAFPSAQPSPTVSSNSHTNANLLNPPAPERYQSPRIPLRGSGSRPESRSASPAISNNTHYEQYHNRSNDSSTGSGGNHQANRSVAAGGRYSSAGEANIPPPAVLRGKFSRQQQY